MDFRTFYNAVIADITPQPWTYADQAGTTLTVVPAGLSADPGCAEVNLRIEQADASGCAEFGITTPDSKGVAEVGIMTGHLPKLISALTEGVPWEDTRLSLGAAAVTPGEAGVVVCVTEWHAQGVEVAVSMTLPPQQRLPLASALRRALDVAKSWED
jgi:hypothetical protein